MHCRKSPPQPSGRQEFQKAWSTSRQSQVSGLLDDFRKSLCYHDVGKETSWGSCCTKAQGLPRRLERGLPISFHYVDLSSLAMRPVGFLMARCEGIGRKFEWENSEGQSQENSDQHKSSHMAPNVKRLYGKVGMNLTERHLGMQILRILRLRCSTVANM